LQHWFGSAPGNSLVVRVHWIMFLSIAMAGCGGGGGEPPTHAEFVARADAVCGEHHAKFEALARDVAAKGKPLGDDEINDWLVDYADLYENMADELADLDRPANDAAIERYLDRVQRNAKGFKNAADEGAAGSEDFGAAATNSSREANSLAEDAGLKVCSPLNQ
jgi:hypothetical protein